MTTTQKIDFSSDILTEIAATLKASGHRVMKGSFAGSGKVIALYIDESPIMASEKVQHLKSVMPANISVAYFSGTMQRIAIRVIIEGQVFIAENNY